MESQSRKSLLNDELVAKILNTKDLSPELKVMVDQWEAHAVALQSLDSNIKNTRKQLATMEVNFHKSWGVVSGLEWGIKALWNAAETEGVEENIQDQAADDIDYQE